MAAGYVRFMLGPLFEPWAADLVARSRIPSAGRVLDVAAGLGPVSRAAASAVGPRGLVVGSDISPAMLEAGRRVAGQDDAPEASTLVLVVGSAGALPVPGGCFDAVLCQQGLQFFPDRLSALGEMRRVLRPGGEALVSVWARERPWGLFGAVVEALAESEVPEPYEGAYDADSRRLERGELGTLLSQAGFADVTVETVGRSSTWPTRADAVGVLAGTPFGPLVGALPADRREAVEASFARRLGEDDRSPVSVTTWANVARGIRPSGA